MQAFLNFETTFVADPINGAHLNSSFGYDGSGIWLKTEAFDVPLRTFCIPWDEIRSVMQGVGRERIPLTFKLEVASTLVVTLNVTPHLFLQECLRRKKLLGTNAYVSLVGGPPAEITPLTATVIKIWRVPARRAIVMLCFYIVVAIAFMSLYHGDMPALTRLRDDGVTTQGVVDQINQGKDGSFKSGDYYFHYLVNGKRHWGHGDTRDLPIPAIGESMDVRYVVQSPSDNMAGNLDFVKQRIRGLNYFVILAGGILVPIGASLAFGSALAHINQKAKDLEAANLKLNLTSEVSNAAEASQIPDISPSPSELPQIAAVQPTGGQILEDRTEQMEKSAISNGISENAKFLD